MKGFCFIWLCKNPRQNLNWVNQNTKYPTTNFIRIPSDYLYSLHSLMLQWCWLLWKRCFINWWFRQSFTHTYTYGLSQTNNDFFKTKRYKSNFHQRCWVTYLFLRMNIRCICELIISHLKLFSLNRIMTVDLHCFRIIVKGVYDKITK